MKRSPANPCATSPQPLRTPAVHFSVRYLLGFAILLPGCAQLESFTRTADRMRQEAAAVYMAADELDRQCAELQEPRPKVCEAARKLMESVSPYVGKAP